MQKLKCNSYGMNTPNPEFTEVVMQAVRKAHSKKQKQAQFVDKLTNNLSVQLIFSILAGTCATWNLIRVYLILLTPVICK